MRFICGTQDLHKELEATIAQFFGTEDTILYSSCFDANGGLFETLLGEEDAIISDALNHASIIDGIRLCKAERHRYANGDMADARGGAARRRRASASGMIATDGVFSMDGYLAKLDAICDLADKYKAMVMVDDSHATGFIGKTGRGTPEHCGVLSRVDVMTSHARQGARRREPAASPPASKEIVELLRQRSRPYLFSNTLPPAIAGASIAVLELLSSTTRAARPAHGQRAPLPRGHDEGGLHDQGRASTRSSRSCSATRGSRGELAKAPARRGHLRDRLLVPGRAEGRGAHPRAALARSTPSEQVDRAIAAFAKVGKRLGVLKS